MELPELRTIELLLALVRPLPPWMVLAGLVGLTSGAAFYVVAGRGFLGLPTYLVLGLVVAPFCQSASTGLPLLPPPLMIGEVHLAFIAVATWALLAIARLLRL